MITKQWLEVEIAMIGKIIKTANDRVINARDELSKAEDDLYALRDLKKEWESQLDDFDN